MTVNELRMALMEYDNSKYQLEVVKSYKEQTEVKVDLDGVGIFFKVDDLLKIATDEFKMAKIKLLGNQYIYEDENNAKN